MRRLDMKRLLLTLALCLPTGAGAQDTPANGGLSMSGRASMSPEMFLRTGDAVSLCLRNEPQWMDFCNGLMQGYADIAIVTGKACIPFGTSRRELVEIFTSPDVVMTTGYIDDLAAYETAMEVFIKNFPCD